MMSGLDIRYDLGEGHPLLGRRMPDLDLVTADGPLRVFTLLHEARPVLLEPRRARRLDIGPWADRVRSVDAALRRARGSFRRIGVGRRPGRRADPARRIRGVGGRRDPAGARRGADDLVRTARRGVASGRKASRGGRGGTDETRRSFGQSSAPLCFPPRPPREIIVARIAHGTGRNGMGVRLTSSAAPGRRGGRRWRGRWSPAA